MVGYVTSITQRLSAFSASKLNKNAPFRTRFRSGGEGGIRISSPQWGRATENKNASLRTRFVLAGRAGERPIVLPTSSYHPGPASVMDC